MAPAATPATPRVLSGCHAACPRCGLHNAALWRHCLLQSPRSFRLQRSGLRPAKQALCKPGSCNRRDSLRRCSESAAVVRNVRNSQSHELRPRHVPSRVLRAVLATVFRRRVTRPDAGHVPLPARRVCLRRLALRCSFPPRQPRCPSAPRGSLNTKSSDAGLPMLCQSDAIGKPWKPLSTMVCAALYTYAECLSRGCFPAENAGSFKENRIMNQTETIQAMAMSADISKAAAERVIDAFETRLKAPPTPASASFSGALAASRAGCRRRRWGAIRKPANR